MSDWPGRFACERSVRIDTEDEEIMPEPRQRRLYTAAAASAVYEVGRRDGIAWAVKRMRDWAEEHDWPSETGCALLSIADRLEQEANGEHE